MQPLPSDPEFFSGAFVQLVNSMGGDLAVIQSARQTVSGKQLTEVPEWGPRFIDEMMRKRHGTPFEAAVFQFRVETSIAVAREWFRHRIGSFNELSLRVSEAKPRFYKPSRPFARRDADVRYEYRPVSDEEWTEGVALYEATIEASWDAYRKLLEIGWSRDLARLVLPVALMTRFTWTVNARALMNFLSLRTAPDAFWEIRAAADCVYELWRNDMPITAIAFEHNGKIAP